MRWLDPIFACFRTAKVKARREAVLALELAAARDDWHAALRAWPRNRDRINRTFNTYRKAKANTLVQGRTVESSMASRELSPAPGGVR